LIAERKLRAWRQTAFSWNSHHCGSLCLFLLSLLSSHWCWRCYSANAGFYAPRPAISSLNERCEQGRIRRTTIGGYSARIAMRFLRSSRWVCCRSPRSSSDRHRFHAKGKGEMSEYAEGGAA